MDDSVVSTADRQVHARGNGCEIVRYARAGKWYMERVDGSPNRYQMVLASAVGMALGHGMEIIFGVPGGQQFDSQVRKRRKA